GDCAAGVAERAGVRGAAAERRAALGRPIIRPNGSHETGRHRGGPVDDYRRRHPGARNSQRSSRVRPGAIVPGLSGSRGTPGGGRGPMARLLTRAALAAVLLVSVCLGVAAAQPAPPPLTQPVNDYAHVVDAESARRLDAMIRSLQRATGDVVVVATVDTFQPYGTID